MYVGGGCGAGKDNRKIKQKGDNVLDITKQMEQRFIKINQLKARCQRLDADRALINVSLTHNHPKRVEKRAVDLATNHNHKSNISKVDIDYDRFDNNQYYCDIIHNFQNLLLMVFALVIGQHSHHWQV